MGRLAAIARQLRREPALPAPPDPGFHELDEGESEIIKLRMRRPIIAGSIVVLVLVFGLLLWATVSSIAGAVVAPGTVRVENNSKIIKHREGGVVRQIYVQEGQLVRRGQVLMRLDPGQVQATVDVWQAQYDSALADIARQEAVMTGASSVRFPAELTARAGNPQTGALIAGQRGLFETEALLYRTQVSSLRSQAAQIATQIQGLRAQMTSTDAQSSTIVDELGGVNELNQLGYAPKTRVLALQRSAAQLKGQRGAQVAEIARAQQAIANINIQVAQIADKRASDAAEQMKSARDKLADAQPKLRASGESLAGTTVRAPVDGYVFNLTQFTEGGVAQPGERLLDIVPNNTPLVISARVRPNDIAQLRAGLPARVTLSAFNPRTTPPVDGVVSLVSADATTDEQGREAFYLVQVKVDPKEIARVGNGVHLSPGMPANVEIVTGSRTIMDYLLGPLTEAMRTALREK